jgi:dihydrofolate reductase
MKQFQAIAAMAENRVIGQRGAMPWHLPEDFRWFKQTTTGHVIVMGRKTFESIGRPLPNRTTLVLSRSGFTHPGVQTVADLGQIDPAADPREFFICGGADVYRQALPLCSDLYLTHVKRTVDGDAWFPPFEHLFEVEALVLDRPEFRVVHYRRRDAAPDGPLIG